MSIYDLGHSPQVACSPRLKGASIYASILRVTPKGREYPVDTIDTLGLYINPMLGNPLDMYGSRSDFVGYFVHRGDYSARDLRYYTPYSNLAALRAGDL